MKEDHYSHNGELVEKPSPLRFTKISISQFTIHTRAKRGRNRNHLDRGRGFFNTFQSLINCSFPPLPSGSLALSPAVLGFSHVASHTTREKQDIHRHNRRVEKRSHQRTETHGPHHPLYLPSIAPSPLSTSHVLRQQPLGPGRQQAQGRQLEHDSAAR